MAASTAGLIILESLAITRLLPAIGAWRTRSVTLALGVLLVMAAPFTLIDPDGFYTTLLRPSLVALWLSQLIVFAVYPMFVAKQGRRILGAWAVSVVASGLAIYGLVTALEQSRGVAAEPAARLPGMTDPSLTGGCLCGGVRFELSEPAHAAGYCHCTRCQRRTGTAASAQARIDGRRFRLVAGRGIGEGLAHPDGGFEKCFCLECGSHLFSRNPDDPTQMSVRMGAFDDDPGVRPSWRAFVAYAAHLGGDPGRRA